MIARFDQSPGRLWPRATGGWIVGGEIGVA
jgi:hypothetical protein